MQDEANKNEVNDSWFEKCNYEVVKKVDGEHNRMAVIKKSNISEEFTVRDVQKQVEDLLKGKLQYANAKTLAESFLTNITNNHPEIVTFLNGLDGEKFAAVSLFCEHKKKLDIAEANIKDFDRAIEIYRKEVEYISKVTGLDFSINEEVKTEKGDSLDAKDDGRALGKNNK